MIKTIQDISRAMQEIDFCTLATRTAGGSIGSRPMSNNRRVDYDGDSWFFTYEDRQMIRDIEQNPNIGVTYMSNPGMLGLLGKPGIFIHVEARATLIRDKSAFAVHWERSLNRWFGQGVETPGLIMILATAHRIHYWDGMSEGEVELARAFA
jgi:general stress protein 26